MARAFVLIWRRDSGSLPAIRQAIGRLPQDLVERYQEDRFWLFATEDLALTECSASTRILGDAFPWRGNDAEPGGSPELDHWGEYISIRFDRDTLKIYRDPSGGLPCYYAETSDFVVLFSHVWTVFSAGLIAPQPDIPMLAQHLAYETSRDHRTCLTGVMELLPGAAIILSHGQMIIDYRWLPDQMLSPGAAITDFDRASEAVRASLEFCTKAWATTTKSPIVELSGGLDSSVVTAALAAAGKRPAAVTLAFDDPRADERHYAQIVANAFELPLLQATLQAEDARCERPPHLSTPRPPLGTLSDAHDAAMLRASPPGSDAYFSGAGGDDVFCSCNTAAPVVDAFLACGFGGPTRKAIADLASLHGETEVKVIWYALQKLARGYRPPKADLSFLASKRVPLPSRHPWLSPPIIRQPGKARQVSAIVAAQSRREGKSRESQGPVRLPLLSQPVIETCLRIPTWLWIREGRDRAVAREAFAATLPPETVKRRLKGDFSAFNWELFHANRAEIETLLLSGFLRRHGVIDPVAVTSEIRSPSLSLVTAGRLLRLASAEAWARLWVTDAAR